MDKIELARRLRERGATVKQAWRTASYAFAVDLVRAYDNDWQAMIDALCKLNGWTGAA